MKYFTKVCVSLLVLLTCGSALYAAETGVIRDALMTKFSQSSKGIVNSVSSTGGHIQIVASKGGIGDENDIIIDTAVALNRANSTIGRWTKVSVTISKTIYSFNRKDFDAFRSGKMGDKQFLNKIIKRKA